MKNKLLLLLLISVFNLSMNAQLHMGLHSDNYAGIYNINFQPADIVDSRYRFDMNIIQTEFSLANNYISLKKAALLDSENSFVDPNFQQNFLSENINGNVKKLYMQLNVMAPLSFYFQFGKKMKNSIGFSTRVRTNLNLDGVEEDFATQIYNDLSITSLLNQGVQNKDLSIQLATWGEVGITYGREIFDFGNHYLKGALTGKLNQGAFSTSVYSDNLDVTFPNDEDISINNSDLSYGISTNFLDFSSSPFDPSFTPVFRPTFSADFGVVYEWRPDIDDYKYELDGDKNVLDPKKNKYKVKASLAFTDLGFLKFERSPFDRTVNLDFQNRKLDDLNAIVANFENNGLADFENQFNLSGLGTTTSPNENFYNMRLPFKINAMVDYNIWKGFYVNATASIAPSFRSDPNKTIGISQYSITPRYEHRWVGVQLPASIDGVGRFHLGTGVRVGPLVFGTNDIIPLLAGKDYDIYGANFYVGLKIPIFARLKDKDKDHVSNKMDKCKKDKGPWESLGCPDSDKDGITDDKDKCPETPGVLALDGCPDADLDGITDMNDDCPETPGIAEFKGCPDTDGDGIKDYDDNCPEIAGLLAFNGCPDTDEDGVEDKKDKCPTEKGSIENEGCPYNDQDGDGIIDEIDECPTKKGPSENKGCPYVDKDGDGIKDKDDKCPLEKGPIENFGCPYSDTDNDGTIDKEDKCINTPGPKENFGCPVIKEEVKEAVKTAFNNLEFYSGKSVIKSSSYTSLQNLAKILVKHPEYKLRIAGHTDSDGSEASNLILSRKRANAVKKYLMQYSLSESVFIIEAYGENQPIATNNTTEGKQKNRRVEMEIITD